jgi:hypothetical protein
MHLDNSPAQDTLDALLAPWARLALSQGIKFQALEELLKAQLVQAASQAAALSKTKITASSISLATGLQRPDVTRLLAEKHKAVAPAPRTISDQVFTRWLNDAQWQSANGQPKALKRDASNTLLGSFDALCQSVSQSVHPKSVQNELVRLHLAEVTTSQSGDQFVTLLADNFTPSTNHSAMLALLAGNAGAHLQAAVSNVVAAQQGQEPQHLEQAVVSDPISPAQAQAVQQLIQQHWQAIKAASVPALEAAETEQANSQQAGAQRIRLGVYVYTEPAITNSKEHL